MRQRTPSKCPKGHFHNHHDHARNVSRLLRKSLPSARNVLPLCVFFSFRQSDITRERLPHASSARGTEGYLQAIEDGNPRPGCHGENGISLLNRNIVGKCHDTESGSQASVSPKLPSETACGSVALPNMRCAGVVPLRWCFSSVQIACEKGDYTVLYLN